MPTSPSVPSAPVPMTTRRSAAPESNKEAHIASLSPLDTAGANDDVPTAEVPLPTAEAAPRVSPTHPLLRKSSSNFGREKILGRYTVTDANLMCSEILDQMNAKLSGSMADAKPPVAINWDDVAAKMASKHKLQWRPRACQELWKFLAYEDAPAHGMDLSGAASDSDDDALAPDSDVEDLGATAEILENKRAAFKLNDKTEKIQPTMQTKGLFETVGAKPRVTPSPKPAKPTPDAEPLRLYPTYHPNGYEKRPRAETEEAKGSYGPLHVVAEQFLKRRKLETFAAQKSTMPVKQLLSLPPQVPPRPVPASGAFDYFKDLYVERTVTDIHVLQQLFQGASPAVLAKCQQLAMQDLERFQRECLRYRLYEKARLTTGSPQNLQHQEQEQRQQQQQLHKQQQQQQQQQQQHHSLQQQQYHQQHPNQQQALQKPAPSKHPAHKQPASRKQSPKHPAPKQGPPQHQYAQHAPYPQQQLQQRQAQYAQHQRGHHPHSQPVSQPGQHQTALHYQHQLLQQQQQQQPQQPQQQQPQQQQPQRFGNPGA
ncbi:hypothetical protein SDRG_03475 [Saprolegnia diclina VS20]|uniref:Uncharacterized protein n=1 Tax=Saprolegnia diclina (strain VS20) TaxID=1156394 RepID=T0QX58_SAPDV|nr:hypothetical protein SDRG_03475 [Saprolegnia diclina VS20]EQC39271.1 hypothetical protein SDRG_03475 [Saprolegnia diclina VS20]|eukprot:XP_008607332.1 hypothetical protein SDRG_03475 [Saprolegnia diclina VS20]